MYLKWISPVLLLVPMAHANRLEPKPVSPVAAVGQAVQQLELEAKNESPAPPRGSADFFDTFELEVDAEEAGRRIGKPQDSDPRIDAYVRWQLTAVADPKSLPDDKGFRRLLQRLPKLPTNPKSEERTIRRFEKEAQRQYSTAETAKAALKSWKELDVETKQWNAWARPARELRAWIVTHAPDDTSRLLAMLETIHAEVESGWNPSDEVKRMDRLCAEIGDRQALDTEEVESFASFSMTLTKTQKPLATNAWAADRTFTVEVGYVAIRDYDVNRWVKRLRYGTPLQ